MPKAETLITVANDAKLAAMLRSPDPVQRVFARVQEDLRGVIVPTLDKHIRESPEGFSSLTLAAFIGNVTGAISAWAISQAALALGEDVDDSNRDSVVQTLAHGIASLTYEHAVKSATRTIETYQDDKG